MNCIQEQGTACGWKDNRLKLLIPLGLGGGEDPGVHSQHVDKRQKFCSFCHDGVPSGRHSDTLINTFCKN